MVWNEAVQFYNHTFENADPRVADWPMMHSPFPTLVICLSYVYVVKYLGPSLMKNREPLDIRWLMAIYNFTMVIFSFLIFYYFGVYGWFGLYSWKCQPVDYSNSPEAIGMANVCWWFYISKFIEFTDTIFFVMRKKYSQVSTLHVIHHGIMPMSVWLGLKFTPGGHSTFFAFVNSFVHILMYIYYGLAAFGPRMNKYLWWKKYMTTIQMIQFLMIFTHAFQLLFINCNYPRGFMYWIGFHAVLFWFLFAEFYKNAYQKKRAERAALKAKETSEEGSPVKNGYKLTNGHSYSNGYANGCSTKNAYTNGNGYVHSNEKEQYSNGVEHHDLSNDSIKKVN
ncbi:Elongation of very long chain fatty acids protein AAEL008004 [Araneus ventricosus]|uniref:Elongation of very long chain fatty acids protein n=1 Tax=Araneus ventricosus TaxID=182803 RepID=A0A4Y2P1F8_ARAVE|nr:Elongation of very long chain fatty acids protein AAEL008004 [Araneus ventricosus]GBN44545.1 Elongation of very long chain fatty acids protein AAEL008004 [Araneus ventricosus]GBN44973.1 Elongation of very long chain fatty acids protein AAEL008004 [Araneus ventricosus]GBN45131.1 Elongation of very long chain fatty acids protein AAEL008004 [Araneus ventricosus]